MMTILDYKEKLLQHPPCEEGAITFSNCKSRKDFFEMLAHPKYADFVLKSMSEGWGPSKEDILALFRPYINGAYTVRLKLNDNRTVRSEVWCDAGDISIGDNVRNLIVIGCDGLITIKRWQVVKILVDPYSSVEIVASDGSLVFVESYGGRVVDVNKNCKIKYIDV